MLVEGAPFALDAARDRRPGDDRRRGPRLQGPAARRAARRHAAARTTARSCSTSTSVARPRIVHTRASRRRAVRTQGPQPPGRRPLRAGADRQGPRGHQVSPPSSGVDYVAVSFPRDAADMEMARQLLRAAGGRRARWSPRSSAHEAIDESRRDHRRVRRRHGGARRPRRGDGLRRAAPALQKTIIQRGARRAIAWSSPRPR